MSLRGGGAFDLAGGGGGAACGAGASGAAAATGAAGALGAISGCWATGFSTLGASTGAGAATLAATGGAAGASSFAGFAASTGATTAGFATTAAGFGGTTPGLAGVAEGAGVATFAIAGVSPGFLIALSTSPGLLIFEKSNLGLTSSARAPPRDSSRAPPPLPARNLRMRSASSASTELECVFFSVTPTFGNTSRIALLFTSSSLARSLIRTFDIRPAFLRKTLQRFRVYLIFRVSALTNFYFDFVSCSSGATVSSGAGAGSSPCT
jgi:hypothetical protein